MIPKATKSLAAIVALFCLLAVAGCCEATKRAKANGGVLILHDKQGRTYVCRTGAGDTFFIDCVKEEEKR